MKPVLLSGGAPLTRLPSARKQLTEEQAPALLDSVTLGVSSQGQVAGPGSLQPKKVAQAPSVKTSELKDSAQASGEQAASGAVGGIFGAALGWVKSFFKTQKFAVNFLRDMRARAEEITREPERVDQHLKAKGLHHDYQPPVNDVNVKLRGKMLIKADMKEFFELWDHWITSGYGSINDRQYADLVLKFRDQARELPLLAHVPMTSEDVFSAEIKGGKMVAMDEVTTAKLAGLIPTSKVSWAYRRENTPSGSNSFEKTVDRYNGDLAEVQRFYNELFDPKQINPNSKATVTFTLEEVPDLELSASKGEFQHNVRAPFSGLIPRKASTMDGQAKLATSVSGQMVPGVAVSTATAH